MAPLAVTHVAPPAASTGAPPAASTEAPLAASTEAPLAATAPLLQLDGFEGPLDLLLELARTQKVDLSRISILHLVEQYLAVVEAAPDLRIELAADWLVMAAWLAWLKSRLLLPQDADAADADDAEAGRDAAALLASRLQALAQIGRAALWLSGRDRLGHEVFARGHAEDLTAFDRSGLILDLPQLLGAYLKAARRTARKRVYRPKPLTFWTMQAALARLRLLLDAEPAGWRGLDAFLPEWLNRAAAQARRAAVAGNLLAGLELARDGVVELRQERPFGPILMRQAQAELGQRAAE